MARLPWEKRKLLYDRLGWHFWPTQEQVCADTTSQFIFFAGGVGCGKSMTAARYMLPELMVPNRRFWIVGPDYRLTRQEFEFLVEAIHLLGLQFGAGPNMPQDGEWYFKLSNGTDVTTKSATRPESLHSVAVDGMIAAEAGQINDFIAINRLLPRVLRTKGDPGWVIFAGTFEGNNTWMVRQFWAAYAGKEEYWAAYCMPSWENGDDFPGGRSDIKIKIAESAMTPEEFMQRFGAVPMSPAGVVLKEFSAERHVTDRAEFDPAHPVQIWVDPGRTYACLAVQIVNNIVRICDEVYLHEGTTERCIRDAVGRVWWSSVMGGWIDVEAAEAATVWQAGAIWQTLAMERGQPLHGIALNRHRVEVQAGNERVRTLLHAKAFIRPTVEPIWLFNGQEGISQILIHPRCNETIKEASLYCYPRDAVLEGNKPVDKYNHAWRAIAYGCVGAFGYQMPWIYNQHGMMRRPMYGRTR